jgi:hypothetical protein
MRQNLFDSELTDTIFRKGSALKKVSLVPADNFALPADAPPYVELNPAGAVDVLMPTSNADREGLFFLISNISAYTITLKTDGDNAFTTAISLATMESTIVFCTGSATQALGWRALATAAST